MSTRMEDALLYGGLGCAGLVAAAAIAYFDGSTNAAWFIGSMSLGGLAIAALEAFDLGAWLKRTTSRGRGILAGLAIVLAAAGTAVYILTDSVAAWWLAPLATFPIVYLLVESNEDGHRADGGGMEGPYTPPDRRLVGSARGRRRIGFARWRTIESSRSKASREKMRTSGAR